MAEYGEWACVFVALLLLLQLLHVSYHDICMLLADEAEGLDYGDEGRQRYGPDAQHPASRQQVAQDGCLQLQPAAPLMGVQQSFAALSAVARVPLQAGTLLSRTVTGDPLQLMRMQWANSGQGSETD
jgi:hypothetical protein